MSIKTWEKIEIIICYFFIKKILKQASETGLDMRLHP